VLGGYGGPVLLAAGEACDLGVKARDCVSVRSGRRPARPAVDAFRSHGGGWEPHLQPYATIEWFGGDRAAVDLCHLPDDRQAEA
jgi:hypothetical protein